MAEGRETEHRTIRSSHSAVGESLNLSYLSTLTAVCPMIVLLTCSRSPPLSIVLSMKRIPLLPSLSLSLSLRLFNSGAKRENCGRSLEQSRKTAANPKAATKRGDWTTTDIEIDKLLEHLSFACSVQSRRDAQNSGNRQILS